MGLSSVDHFPLIQPEPLVAIYEMVFFRGGGDEYNMATGLGKCTKHWPLWADLRPPL